MTDAAPRLVSLLALTLLGACASPGDAPSPVPGPAHVQLVPGPDGIARVPVDAPAPDLALIDLDFMTGRWIGEAFGGVVEETWNPALGGQMLGTFRLVSDGEPNFSEHMLMASFDGRLALRLKHFHADLEGWEEKDGHVQFDLLSTAPGRAYFDGLTFVREGDELKGYLSMVTKDGFHIEEFTFRRATR